MKKLIVFLLLILPVTSFGQKLIKDERDKFTKMHVMATSYEKIWRDAVFGGLIEVSAKNMDGSIYLWFWIHDSVVFSVNEGDIMYVLLENDKSIQLMCINGGVASPTKYMWHASVGYEVSKEQMKDLLASGVVGLRIDQTGGYVTKEIKSKYKDVISACLKLVNQ